MTDEIEVTQADRNEAEKHWLWLLDDERDELALAFARHRQAAFAAGQAARERAIVEWLRGPLTDKYNDEDFGPGIDLAADAIEQGEV